MLDILLGIAPSKEYNIYTLKDIKLNTLVFIFE